MVSAPPPASTRRAAGEGARVDRLPAVGEHQVGDLDPGVAHGLRSPARPAAERVMPVEVSAKP